MRSKIRAKWLIKFPIESKVLIKRGDVVNLDQLLVEVNLKKIESFDFSQFLGTLTPKKREELNEQFKNTWVNNGDLVCMKGRLFPNKLCFPMSGNFIEIDEFGNLKIELGDVPKKDILSPVRAVVSRIEDEKIILDFEAKEFKGKGLVEGKIWGNKSETVISELKNINSDLKGKILFTNNLEKSFLVKAEVVGVVGIVTNTIPEEISSKLPILYLDDDEWKDFIKIYDTKSNRLLLNSNLGRLLVVVE